MELLLEDPVTLRVPPGLAPGPLAQLREFLTATDTSAKYQLHRWRKSRPWKERGMGSKAFEAEERRLEARVTRPLLFEDDRGLWTYSGNAPAVSGLLRLPVRVGFDVPAPRPIPWQRTPQQLVGGPPHDHQVDACDRLLAARHGAAEYATGSGKSLTIAMYLRSLGLRSVVAVYSGVVARQLHGVLAALLGSRFVGIFDGTTKDVGKLVTICTALSLRNVRPGTPAWDHFSQADVFVGDESHTFAADVLLGVSVGVMRRAAYRAFVSATQMRADGLDLLLAAVIGPVVAELSFAEAVRRDVLARPHFATINYFSKVECCDRDSDRLTRAHVYESEDVAALAAAVGRSFCLRGYSVLYLVEEYSQAALLLRRLPADAAALHGCTGGYQVELSTHRGALRFSPARRVRTSLGEHRAEDLLARWPDRDRETDPWVEVELSRSQGSTTVLCKKGEAGGVARVPLADVQPVEATGQALLPARHQDVDAAEVVARFNAGDVWELVTTSAGRVGVDLKAPRPMALLYLVGGTSPIAQVQSIGRGARRQGKDHFYFLDLRVVNVPALDAQADKRAAICEQLYERPLEVKPEDLL